MSTTHVSDSSFDSDVLKAAGPVLVDFWAEWCGPCKMIAPVLEDVGKQYAGRLTVAKLDIDANPGIATQFGIRGIPTIGLFEGGRLTKEAIGARPRHAIELELGLSRFAPAVKA